MIDVSASLDAHVGTGEASRDFRLVSGKNVGGIGRVPFSAATKAAANAAADEEQENDARNYDFHEPAEGVLAVAAGCLAEEQAGFAG